MKPPVRTAIVVVTLGLAAFTALPRAQQASAAKLDLKNPAAFTEKAPDVFLAQFDTSVGMFVIRVTRNWAPNAADRFYNLVKNGFYDECRFFRVVPDMLVQWGIHGDPAVAQAWLKAYIKPDRAKISNTRGKVTFAASTGASTDQGTRATQVFINYGDNNKMDLEGFGAFGEVITSMVMVQRIFDKYGDGIDPIMLLSQGNAWLTQAAPQLDYIKTATIAPNAK